MKWQRAALAASEGAKVHPCVEITLHSDVPREIEVVPGSFWS